MDQYVLAISNGIRLEIKCTIKSNAPESSPNHPPLHPQMVETLSSTKLVPGAKKVGDHCPLAVEELKKGMNSACKCLSYARFLPDSESHDKAGRAWAGRGPLGPFKCLRPGFQVFISEGQHCVGKRPGSQGGNSSKVNSTHPTTWSQEAMFSFSEAALCSKAASPWL